MQPRRCEPHEFISLLLGLFSALAEILSRQKGGFESGQRANNYCIKNDFIV
jgi:hypothetical protein